MLQALPLYTTLRDGEHGVHQPRGVERAGKLTVNMSYLALNGWNRRRCCLRLTAARTAGLLLAAGPSAHAGRQRRMPVTGRT